MHGINYSLATSYSSGIAPSRRKGTEATASLFLGYFATLELGRGKIVDKVRGRVRILELEGDGGLYSKNNFKIRK